MALQLHYPADDPPPPMEWEVPGIIPSRSLVTLAGPPGCGKSALAVSLGLAIVTRARWLGLPTLPGAVLFIAAEASHSTRRRVLAGLEPGNRGAPIVVTSGEFNLIAPEAHQQIAHAIHQIQEVTGQPVRLTVLDALGSATRGADENSGKDMGLAMGSLLKVIAATDTSVLLLAHTPHRDGEKRVRGHSGLLADVDAHLAITAAGAAKVLEVVKMRDAESGLKVRFMISENGTVAALVQDRAPPLQPQSEARKLSPDVELVLNALLTIGQSSVDIEEWRPRAYAALGDRKPAALRRAFLDARNTLIDAGEIAIEGDSVRTVRGVRKREEDVRNLTPGHGRGREEDREEETPSMEGFLTGPHAHGPCGLQEELRDRTILTPGTGLKGAPKARAYLRTGDRDE